jgi:integrase
MFGHDINSQTADLGLIKAVFSAALEDQLIAVNPCRKIARQPVAASKVVPLTVDQVERLVASTPAHYKALVITSVGTGLRQGEALGLRAMDVDFLRREVHVRHQLVSVPGIAAHLGPPKTASSLRTVPAPAFVLSALAEHLRMFAPGPFGVIFSNTRGMAVNRQSLHRSLAAAVRGWVAGGHHVPPAASHLCVPAHRRWRVRHGPG